VQVDPKADATQQTNRTIALLVNILIIFYVICDALAENEKSKESKSQESIVMPVW
jgi:hypothetical protein